MSTLINEESRPEILALDFDGVLCASSIESSFSSIIAAQKFWPKMGKIIDYEKPFYKLIKSSYLPIELEEEGSKFFSIRQALNILRPIVETGFENMLLVRVLSEELQKTGVIDYKSLIERWTPVYRDQLISQFGTNKEELVQFFGKTRDDLIAEDPAAWVGLNGLYPCVSECLSNISPKKLHFTIITTKQERFVKTILEKNKVTPPGSKDIYDLDNPYGAKTKVLAALQNLQINDDKKDDISENSKSRNKIHFVEDRYETLLNIIKIPELDDIQLYLVDWGYNTQAQRIEAISLSPRVKLINGDDFKTLVSRFIY